MNRFFVLLFVFVLFCLSSAEALANVTKPDQSVIFLKNQISAGYFNEDLFDPDFPRPPSPIFWHAVKKMRSGVMMMYQRLLYHNHSRFSLYFGTSFSRWKRFDQVIYAPSIFIAMRYWFIRTREVNFYLSYSIAGPTVLNTQHLAEKNLGSHFIFQDYLGLGVQFGKKHALNVDLRLVHYSNGDLFTHNPGFDVPVVLYLGYSF